MAAIFTFNRVAEDGTTTPERVVLERWRWRAIYEDGQTIDQFDFATMTFHQFSEIDRERVRVWQMIHDDRPPVTFLIQPGDKIEHFYRVIGLDFMGEHQRVKIYYFGFVRGGRRMLAAITPEDEIIMTDEPDNIQVEGA